MEDERGVDVKKQSSFKSSIRDLCEGSTIHGIAPILAAKNVYTRLFWIVIFSLSCALLVWQVYTLSLKVRSKDTVTMTTNVKAKDMEFPVITICNANPYSLLKSDSAFQSKFNLSLYDASTPDEIKHSGWTEFSLKEIQEASVNLNEFMMVKMNTSTFAGKPITNIPSIFRPLLGNCLCFATGFKQNQPGPDSGLSVVLNINESDYSPFFSDGYGIFILVNRDGYMDYWSFKNKAIAAAPGTLTRIKMHKTEIKRLPYPYPDACVNNKIPVKEIETMYFTKECFYSYDMCSLIFMFKWQMLTCGYIDSRYKRLLEDNVDIEKSQIVFNKAANSTEIEKEMACLNQARVESHNNNKCKPSCFDEQYEFMVSSLRWPTKLEAKELLKNMQKTWPTTSNVQNWTTDSIYDNLVKIQIYFDDFHINQIEQRPAYGWNDFISDFGGQAGLWIGASVYSGFEIGSILLSFVAGIMNYIGGKKISEGEKDFHH